MESKAHRNYGNLPRWDDGTGTPWDWDFLVRKGGLERLDYFSIYR